MFTSPHTTAQAMALFVVLHFGLRKMQHCSRKWHKALEHARLVDTCPAQHYASVLALFFLSFLLSCAIKIWEDAFLTLSRVNSSSSSPFRRSSLSLSAPSSSQSSSSNGRSILWL
mmetsp:Transcript_3679/g.11674  ORF Transcript_3679/g.11674 Transcript_3679/m.11674 type:complete len:115 (+) Transcript_3679:77-421(+)